MLYEKISGLCIREKFLICFYNRESFVFPAGNTRVTINREIKTGLFSKNIFSEIQPTLSIGEPYIILEVKYGEYLPKAISDVVKLRNRRIDSFSKYKAVRIYG